MFFNDSTKLFNILIFQIDLLYKALQEVKILLYYVGLNKLYTVYAGSLKWLKVKTVIFYCVSRECANVCRQMCGLKFLLRKFYFT